MLMLFLLIFCLIFYSLFTVVWLFAVDSCRRTSGLYSFSLRLSHDSVVATDGGMIDVLILHCCVNSQFPSLMTVLLRIHGSGFGNCINLPLILKPLRQFQIPQTLCVSQTFLPNQLPECLLTLSVLSYKRVILQSSCNLGSTRLCKCCFLCSTEKGSPITYSMCTSFLSLFSVFANQLIYLSVKNVKEIRSKSAVHSIMKRFRGLGKCIKAKAGNCSCMCVTLGIIP